MSDMRVNNQAQPQAAPNGLDTKNTQSTQGAAPTMPATSALGNKAAGSVNMQSTMSPTMSSEAVGGLAAMLNAKNGRTAGNVQTAMAPTTEQGISKDSLSHLKKTESAPAKTSADDKSTYQKVTEKVGDVMPVLGWLMKGIGKLFGQ